MLLSAIKNSDVDSTLFALLFGANVNCSLVNSCKPITTACKSGSDTMVSYSMPDVTFVCCSDKFDACYLHYIETRFALGKYSLFAVAAPT